jgi:hypothetical protein
MFTTRMRAWKLWLKLRKTLKNNCPRNARRKLKWCAHRDSHYRRRDFVPTHTLNWMKIYVLFVKPSNFLQAVSQCYHFTWHFQRCRVKWHHVHVIMLTWLRKSEAFIQPFQFSEFDNFADLHSN